MGRVRELGEGRRILDEERHLVIRGEHGEGKTAVAVEIARRGLEAGQIERVAYVSLEVFHDGRGVRFSLGQQLVPSYRLAVSQDPRLALQLLERLLREHPTLVILDDFEAVLPNFEGAPGDPRIYEPTVLDQILLLASELKKVGRTSLIFVTRAPIPEPFHEAGLELAGLAADDAAALVGAVAVARRGAPEAADGVRLAPLIETLGSHAGSLVALGGEIAAAGVDAAARTLAESVAAIGGQELGERRRALALGAEIALRAVPAATRRQLPRLGVFRGGGHLTAVAAVLELDVESDEEVRLAEMLIGLGLAEMLSHNYLRFHPALRAALGAELAGAELAAARASWIEATRQLVVFLSREQIKSPQLAASLAFLDLRNLLACLEHLDETAAADEVVVFANELESLIGPLGRPEALRRIDNVRARASRRLAEWSRERFLMESAALEMLMDAGRPQETVAAARRLLHRAQTVGEGAYEGAELDLATVHLTLGLAQLMAGEAEGASSSFEEARRRFHALAADGHREAASLEAQAIARTGDAMRALGLREMTVQAYRRAIEMAEDLGERPLVAEVKTRFGELRLAQDRTAEALAAYEEARAIFAELGELRTVAGIWHQVGSLHRAASRFVEAEAAYREALDLELSEGDRRAAASTRGEIGDLQAEAGRLGDAVRSFAAAAEIFAELDDLAKEGIARSQMADKLIRLGRYDEARGQLERTIECDAPFGHQAEPWRTFSMLASLEMKAGREDALRRARERAIQAYLHYRRDGGESQVGHGEIFDETTRAILAGETATVAAKLEGMLRRRDLPAPLRSLIPALQAVLEGSRDPALATDPNLYYRDAAELLLRLERLEGARSEAPDVVF